MVAADDAAGGRGHKPLGDVGRMPGQLQAEDAAAKEFQTFLDLLPKGPEPAIWATDGRKPLTFAALQGLAKKVNPAAFGIGRTDRLCVVMLNGPESASAFLTLSHHCVYAPLNIKLTEPELAFEFEDLPAKAVVLQAYSVEGGARKEVDSSGIVKMAKQMNVPILELSPDLEECGLFSLAWHAETPLRLEPLKPTKASRGDLALVLHTSGTTKKPKIVPLTHENIAVGSQCIASTLQLKKGKDLGINIMPLFHIHGLSINVLASMLSGAPILATPGFDVDNFFKWVEEKKPSWYSAVPTMHQQILERAQEQKRQNPKVEHSLQLVRNCSAALLPHVAEGLEEAFSCTVMPTYAMTESMPIASNPRTADRGTRKLRAEQRGDGGGTVGSVGLSGGPIIRLCNDDGGPVPAYSEGEICVRGECVTAGYEFRSHMDTDPNISAFHKDEAGGKWLRTGDKGWVDGDGFLALTGRFKEIINRGGEKISPLEVEEVLRTHSGVRDLIAFAAPHEELGEVVAAAIVESANSPFPEDPEEAIASLRKHGANAGLNQKWLPDCIVFLEAVPKGPTGKPARINLASRLHMPALSGASRAVYDVEGPPPAVDKAPFAQEKVTRRRPAQAPRPGMALQGARVVFNCMVFFNHIGFTNIRGLQQIRNNAGYTMTGFFFMLGFTLTSAVPKHGIPLSEIREFWVSRMGPPHAVFVLEVFVSFVQWHMRCSPEIWAKCRNDWMHTFWEFLEGALTSRGVLHEHCGGYTWFVTKMYWFIVLFPLYDYVCRKIVLPRKWLLRTLVVISTIGAATISPVTTYFYQVPSPYTTRIWIFTLWCGMLCWHVFQQAPRRTPERRRMWGLITDLMTIPMLLVFVVVWFDTCAQRPYKYHPFHYTCKEIAYTQWRFRNNQLTSTEYWNGRNMFWLSVFRLISPVEFVWFYGLSVGEGRVASLLSHPWLSKFLAPLAYNVFVMQMPAFWTWWYLTRGLHWQTLYSKMLPFPIQAPLPMPEAVCLLVMTYCFSWFYDRYMSPYLVPPTVRIADLVTKAAFWPLTAVGIIKTEGAAETTLGEVLQTVKRLTGNDFTAEDRIEDLNLDSFGTMALIGMLKASKPHLTGLRPGVLMELKTVGGLVAYIDAASDGTGGKVKKA